MRIWRVPYPKFGKGPGLERVSKIAGRLGVDLPKFGETGAVIVGSNGKGSTAAMAAALLQADARSVGLFTSPHLFDLNERFRIDGEDISDDELQHHWDRVAAAIEVAGETHAVGGFDFLFLIAADWFATRNCTNTVWEAGIGGRLDPVRLLEAKRLALTSLDLEHTELLGSSLEEIAQDKVEAAPNGAVVFAGESCAPLFASIERHCASRGVRAELVRSIAATKRPPLFGEHQRANVALALALAGDIAPVDELGEKRLSATRWPGRLEVLAAEPLVVIDVGHTPNAVAVALESFKSLRGERTPLLVCGVSQDKSVTTIVSVLAPAFSTIICAAARHKGASASQVAAAASAANPGAELVLAESVADARKIALTRAGTEGAIYVAGGLFLAAEFRALHLGRDPATLLFF